jgi:hypothetical protein
VRRRRGLTAAGPPAWAARLSSNVNLLAGGSNMRRTVPSTFLCVALAMAGLSGCTSGSSSSKTGDQVLLLEIDEIDLAPEAEKQVNVKSGTAVTAEAPKDSGVTAKVEDGKVKIAAGKDAKEGTHEVKVKDAKGKEATVKVKVKKQGGQ